MSVRAIVDAVNGARFAEADKLLKQALSENPDSAIFHGLKALTEFKQHNRPAALEAVIRAASLRGPLVVLSNFLLPVLVAYDQPALLNSAFEAVNRREPANRELANLWLEAMLELGNIRGIHKALMAKLKIDPQSRSAHFQVCFLMVLVHSETKPGQPEKSLFPALAVRMLDKVLPVRTAQECYVAARVYEMAGETTKLVDFIDKHGRFAESLLELQLLKLDALLRSHNWEQIWEYTQSQLRGIDSYNYWQALNEAAVHLKRIPEVKVFAEQFTGNNSLLGAADLAQRLGEPVEPLIYIYWRHMQDKPVAYEYMRAYPQLLGKLEVNHQSLGCCVNEAKLRYTWSGDADVESLVALHASGERPTDMTDYYIGTDALVVAAAALIGHGELIRAAVVLEHASKVDPHHFQVRLWLVHLYRQLGCATLALGHFDALSVKNVQFESLGYLVSTRASSLLGKKHALQVLTKQATVYDGETASLGSFGSTALEKNVYTQLHGIFNLSTKLRCSLSHAIVVLETVKTSRLGRGSGASLDTVVSLHESEEEYIDNRDFSTIFDPRNVLDTLEQPRQGAQWILLTREKELIYTSLLAGRSVDSEKVRKFAAKIHQSTELTAVEKWCALVVAALATGDKIPAQPPSPSPSEVWWEVLHFGYTLIEAQKICDDFAVRYRRPECRINIVSTVKGLCQGAVKVAQVSSLDDWYHTVGLAQVASSVQTSITKSRLEAVKSLESLVK